MKEIKLQKNMISKKYSNNATMASKCNCGNCSCNCGAGCLAPLLAKKAILSIKNAY